VYRADRLVCAVYGLPAHLRRIVTAPSPQPGSGDRAVAAAAERAKTTASRNIPVFADLPLPADTANLREGANLHDALLALLPLVGVWRGEGEGRGPHGDYRFGQQIVVSHDGRDYLNWEARSWRLTDTGEFRQRPRRSGRDAGDRAFAGPLRRLRGTLLRAPAQPVVVGTRHRRVGAQPIRGAGWRREATVRNRRGR